MSERLVVRGLPQPLVNEHPIAYANRLGQWYLSWNRPKKEQGQFFTPPSVAEFMAQLVLPHQGITRVLDPGAGVGILSCALCETFEGDVELEAYETDADLADCLEACLSYAQEWMRAQNRALHYKVIRDDFVLVNAWALQSPVIDPFDVVICNPPYFKLSKADPRARAAEAVVFGQPNIYALFIAISAALLRPDGQAVFITPRSYAAGQYFSRFREYFFARMRPLAIHLFDSRRDVFDDVLQESMIMLAKRATKESHVIISSSSSSRDFSHLRRRTLPISEVLDKDNVLHVPLSERDDIIAGIVRSWTGSLRRYGMEISTGPVVPFRAVELVTATGNVPLTHAPLLWMQNIQSMQFIWPESHKKQYIVLNGAEKLLLPNQNYVLLRRFSAKEERRRLVAAPYLAELKTPVIGLENHLNYIYRPEGKLSADEARGLAILMNSDFMDTYFRMFSGNTQVSATELRHLPLPPLGAIIEMGRRATRPDVDIYSLAAEVLGIYA